MGVEQNNYERDPDTSKECGIFELAREWQMKCPVVGGYRNS
jgi:hypothetical protein